MRKFIGWIQIVLCSMLLLVGAICLCIILPLDEAESKMFSPYATWTAMGIVIVTMLLVVGLIKGIKKVMAKKTTTIVKHEKELNINLSGKVEYKDYRNLILGVILKRPTFLVIPIIMAFYLSILFIFDNESSDSHRYNYTMTILFIAILILRPLVTFRKFKRFYNSNKLFTEHLNYSLNNESINIKGETVDSTLKWTRFYKIKESKSFFILYQGETIESLLDKKMFSENEITEFRQFAKSINAKKLS